MTTPANIILITVDCLRADFLGCYGSSIATPHLDRLASEGIRYQYAFSHSSFTKPTFPTIFSSTYPGQHGGSRRFAETRPNIVSILQAHGYQTLGVNSNPWLSPRFGFHRGYTHYHDLSSATPVAHSLPVRLLNNLLGLVGGGLIYPPYPPAQEVTDAALALRKKATSPYFLWLHYMDAHWPYGVDRPHLFGPWDRQKWAYNARLAQKTRRAPEQVRSHETEALMTLYRRGIATIDRQIGRLLGVVDAGEVVLLTADHGEAFGEHGRYHHLPALHMENVHVPLLLRAPGVVAGTVETQIVRHIDIAPTLAALAGITAPSSFQGHNLLPAARGMQPLPPLKAFSTIHAQHGQWLAIRYKKLTALVLLHPQTQQIRKKALYHFRNDPGETMNLVMQRPAEMETLQKELLAYAKEFVVRPRASDPADGHGPDMTEEMKERLRVLGYLE